MVKEEKLLVKKKEDVTPDMKYHPKNYPLHCLIGHALEDFHGFKSWLDKAIKSGAIILRKEYF